MATQIQIRRGTAAEWAAEDPILAEGEIGFETDTDLIKIGDGTRDWSDLDYISTTAVAPTQTEYALEFDDTLGHHVYAGKFQQIAPVSYGNCYYDWFAKPSLGAEYVFSMGYGGAHSMLAGYDGGSGTRIGIAGNVSNAAGGSVDVSFDAGSDDAFIDHWHHAGVGIFLNTLVVYMNGVACKRFTKATDRASLFDSDLGLYIGGSDHSNYKGLLSWVRVWEDDHPFYTDPTLGTALRVSPRPAASYYEAVSGLYKPANIVYDFSQRSNMIVNLGTPLHAGDLGHGYRNAGTNPGIFQAFQGYTEASLPQFVGIDPITQPNYNLTPTAVPSGAKIFDSFKRNDSVYLWTNTLSLGSTEGGSLGAQAWSYTNPGTQGCGILFGRAFCNGLGSSTTRAHVTNDLPYMIAQVKNNGNETEGAVLFAAYDFATDTGIQAIHGSLDTIVLYKYDAGTPTNLGSYVIPGTNAPYTLGIEYTTTKQINLLIDGTVQVTHDDSANPALTGVDAGFSALTTYVRFEDFEVRDATA
jgi:hypothetical protein